MTYKYFFENLDCEHCAHKLEEEIMKIEGISEVSVTYPDCVCLFSCDENDLNRIKEGIINIVKENEPEVNVEEYHHHHNHEEHNCECHSHHHEEHEHNCGCGHNHHHDHDHCESEDEKECECHSHHHHEEKATYLFSITNIDCQNCANKLEESIKKIDGIENVSLSFLKETLQYDCDHDEAKEIEEKVRHLIKKEEPDVLLTFLGHKHHHEHHHEEEKEVVITELTKKYRIEGLDCENCAKRIERKLASINGISNVNVSYIHSSISFDCEDKDLERIKKEVNEIVSKEEDEAIIYFEEVKKTVEKELDNDKEIIIRLILGALLFFISLFLKGNIKTIITLISYLILGYDVLLKAIKNIGRGQIFDENFLMAIATIAAIYLQDYSEATGVMLFYQVGEFFQDLAVKRSRRSIGELMDIKSNYARVIRDDNSIEVDPSDVLINEIIEVKPGEIIPIDGVIIEGSSSLNTASLTGESVLRDVSVNDEVMSGVINENGVIRIRTTKRYEDSAHQKILNLIEDAETKKATHEKFISKFARYYTPLVVIAAIITAIVVGIISKDINEGIYRACTFLVISCPCALVISIPLSFFAGIGGLSKKGILVKGADVIEELANIKQVVMDKTGTLTKGEFYVEDVLDTNNKEEVVKLAALLEQHSNHPIAKAIVKDVVIDREVKGLKEIAGHGLSGYVDDSLVLVGNIKLMKDYNIDITEHNLGTCVYVAKDNKYEGCIVLKDEVKENTKEIISKLKGLNLKTIMLSGDSKDIVEEIKKKTNIDEAYGECLPNDKVDILEKIKSNGEALFVGDGINDAPVLVSSNVGMAMGALGSDAAIEAADIVLMDDNLESVLVAYKNSKRILNVAKQNIYGAIIIKILTLILGALGIANMWMAIFADTGVAMLCVLNAIRLLKAKE